MKIYDWVNGRIVKYIIIIIFPFININNATAVSTTATGKEAPFDPPDEVVIMHEDPGQAELNALQAKMPAEVQAELNALQAEVQAELNALQATTNTLQAKLNIEIPARNKIRDQLKRSNRKLQTLRQDLPQPGFFIKLLDSGIIYLKMWIEKLNLNQSLRINRLKSILGLKIDSSQEKKRVEAELQGELNASTAKRKECQTQINKPGAKQNEPHYQEKPLPIIETLHPQLLEQQQHIEQQHTLCELHKKNRSEMKTCEKEIDKYKNIRIYCPDTETWTSLKEVEFTKRINALTARIPELREQYLKIEYSYYRQLRSEKEALKIKMDNEDAAWYWDQFKEYVPTLKKYIYHSIKNLFEAEKNPDDESDITPCEEKLALHEENLILQEQTRARRLRNLILIDQCIALSQLPTAIDKKQDTTCIKQTINKTNQELAQLQPYIKQPLSESYPYRFLEYLVIAAWRGAFSKSKIKAE